MGRRRRRGCIHNCGVVGEPEKSGRGLQNGGFPPHAALYLTTGSLKALDVVIFQLPISSPDLPVDPPPAAQPVADPKVLAREGGPCDGEARGSIAQIAWNKDKVTGLNATSLTEAGGTD